MKALIRGKGIGNFVKCFMVMKYHNFASKTAKQLARDYEARDPAKEGGKMKGFTVGAKITKRSANLMNTSNALEKFERN